ncbi:MAG: MarC family protein [Burkholderiaceae bacterium]
MDSFKTFISLLALVNPLGAIPFFISFTATNTRAERRRIVRIASITVAFVIAFTTLLGQQVINFFGITVNSFQVGGGIIMLLMAISMINAQPGGTKTTPEEAVEGEQKENIAVVPLAIPLLTGPGTISTVIIYADKAETWWQRMSLIGSGVAIALLVFLALSAADPISRALGRTGINVATRLMGLMLAALGVELIVDGLIALIPALRH